MNRLLLLGASALFLIACSKTPEATTPSGAKPGDPAATAAATNNQVVIDLGQVA